MDVLSSQRKTESAAIASPGASGSRSAGADRTGWVRRAIDTIEADGARSAETHLVRVPLPFAPDIGLYLKDETGHPSGSLKHRLARALLLNALCSGWIGPQTTLIEASSGSTAVSEAYFARLLGLRFVAVVPAGTSREKLDLIAAYGGECRLVPPGASVYEEAGALAKQCGGLYLDQFTHAERVGDWRGPSGLAQSIFTQMAREPHAVPRWIVCGAGTGGTSATIGRYIRYHGHATGLCVCDPAGSVFHRHYADRRITEIERCDSLIEGIGRARVEPSFIPDAIDRMIVVEDAESLAGVHVLGGILGRRCGGSTGTNIWAAAKLVSQMMAEGESGSVVTLFCDPGERYLSTQHDPDWLAANVPAMPAARERLEAFFRRGEPLT